MRIMKDGGNQKKTDENNERLRDSQMKLMNEKSKYSGMILHTYRQFSKSTKWQRYCLQLENS
jgi:hypothetical protein